MLWDAIDASLCDVGGLGIGSRCLGTDFASSPVVSDVAEHYQAHSAFSLTGDKTLFRRTHILNVSFHFRFEDFFLFFSRKLFYLTVVLQPPPNSAVSVATSFSFSRHHATGVLAQEEASHCLALPRHRSSSLFVETLSDSVTDVVLTERRNPRPPLGAPAALQAMASLLALPALSPAPPPPGATRTSSCATVASAASTSPAIVAVTANASGGAAGPTPGPARSRALNPCECRRCIQILSRRTNKNPVLIGELGVGKTVISEGNEEECSSWTECA
ncbi:hypothetical protein LR48_Vigan02g086700 [Vigna angularis]|uniref:Uncharacterized protein n=1 Tax=Phaseolus angularis TaxID=3914 RepID=A0A0L9TWC9_PHAAN|nr:hypothetical protein LR48_Vigan02g086700 [Vigna angularis]